MAPFGSTGGRKPELALRVASAIVLIAVTLAAAWLGGAVFAAFCAAVSALVLIEYLRIAEQALPAGMGRACLMALGVVAAGWFGLGPTAAVWITAACVLGLAGWEVAVRRTFWGAAGLACTALPFLALALLRATGPTGAQVILLLFGLVWATDTFAYFAGRAIGGPKLAPRISPNKTVAGFAGGLAGAIVVGLALLAALGHGLSGGAIMLVAALSIVAQLGDLAESWMKRRFGVKDSGAIIPGHGGMFDRIDGLILAAVATWVAGGLAGGGMLVPGGAGEALFAAFVLP